MKTSQEWCDYIVYNLDGDTMKGIALVQKEARIEALEELIRIIQYQVDMADCTDRLQEFLKRTIYLIHEFIEKENKENK
jgi:hypothetical protein